MDKTEVRKKGTQAAMADPIMQEPVVLWMVEEVAGMDPISAAPHIRFGLDSIAEIESSGGWNTRGKPDKKTGNRALGVYQWFPQPFKEDLDALNTYMRKAAGKEPSEWETPGWIDKALDHKDPNKLSRHQQEMVMMARETRLVDNDDLRRMWSGDVPALRDFFAIKHHTQGYQDKDTLDQMDIHMPLVESEPEKPASGREPAASALARQTEKQYATPDLVTPINSGMLSEIADLPTRRGGGEILDEVLSGGRRVPESYISDGLLTGISVPDRQRRYPDLENVRPSQRMQVPDQTGKPNGFVAGQSLGSTRVPPTSVVRPNTQPPVGSNNFFPPPVALEEITPTQKGQVPIPQPRKPAPPAPPPSSEPTIQSTLKAIQDSIINSEAVIPDEPWVPAVNAIVEEPKPEPKKGGWLSPKSMRAAKPELPEVDIDMSAVLEASKAKVERDQKQQQGITRSVMEGLTFDLYDEASAYLDAKRKGIPYDLARTRYNRQQREFELMNPNLSMGLELAGSIAPGIGGFKALETASQMLNKAAQTRRITAGREAVSYQPKSKTVVREGADGKPERVTVAPDPRDVRVVEDLGNGRVMIQDGTRTYAVNKSTLSARGKRAEVGPASNATLGTIEGGFWGFNAGEDNDRVTSAAVGGVAGLAMGRAIDMFKAPKYNNIGADADEDMILSVDKSFYDQANLLNKQFLRNAQEANANPVQDDGIAAMFGEPAPVPAPFSYIDQFTESPLAKKEKRTGLAGTWDAAVEKYKEVALGVSDRLMLDFSPQWGARVQAADETALRTLAREISMFVDPIAPVLDLEISDLNFRGLMLDYAKGEATLDEVTNYVAPRLGGDMAEKLKAYIAWADGKNQQHILEVTGKTYSAPSYLSTRLSPTKKAEKDSMDRDFDLPDDPGLMNRTRGNYKDGAVKPEDYMPVLATNMRRIMNNERMVQIARKLNMPLVKNMETADDFFAAMERHVIDMGLDADLAKRGTLLIKDNLVGQIRSPAQWIQALNSFGYATTLAGPMSALLNLHDPMVASVKYGFGNTMKGLTQPSYDVRARGIDQNVGEFMNKVVDMYANDRAGFESMVADAARTGTDWLMKGSGFAAMDNMGKSGTIKAILNHASEVAAKDSKTAWANKKEQFTQGKLARQWGFYFNRAELEMIQNELMKHGGDFTKYSGSAAKLLEELAFAGLGQQQLISGMGRPAAWARHPNLRPMWALRGFAIKQQALIMREIMFNIANGRTDDALKFMARYVALAAGSFGLLNESRQWIFGDGEASFPGFLQSAADQIVSTMSLNTIGLNDYQYGRLMESGPVSVVAESLLPLPATRAYDIGKAIYQGITDPNKNLRTEVMNEIPLLRQPPNAIQNLAENTDHLIPKPLENLEETLRPGEQR
ncbi:MAG: hypothetical protein VW715_07045 [Rhodospirillales bacterium]